MQSRGPRANRFRSNCQCGLKPVTAMREYVASALILEAQFTRRMLPQPYRRQGASALFWKHSLCNEYYPFLDYSGAGKMSEFAVISSLIFYIYYSIFFRESQIFFVSLMGEPVAFGESRLLFSTPSLIFYIYYSILLKKSQSFFYLLTDVDGARSIFFLQFQCIRRFIFCVMRGQIDARDNFPPQRTFYPCNRQFSTTKNIFSSLQPTSTHIDPLPAISLLMGLSLHTHPLGYTFLGHFLRTISTQMTDQMNMPLADGLRPSLAFSPTYSPIYPRSPRYNVHILLHILLHIYVHIYVHLRRTPFPYILYYILYYIYNYIIYIHYICTLYMYIIYIE